MIVQIVCPRARKQLVARGLCGRRKRARGKRCVEGRVNNVFHVIIPAHLLRAYIYIVVSAATRVVGLVAADPLISAMAVSASRSFYASWPRTSPPSRQLGVGAATESATLDIIYPSTRKHACQDAMDERCYHFNVLSRSPFAFTCVNPFPPNGA